MRLFSGDYINRIYRLVSTTVRFLYFERRSTQTQEIRTAINAIKSCMLDLIARNYRGDKCDKYDKNYRRDVLI